MPITNTTIVLVFLLFCRIGTCLMLMPGFSTARVPQQIRLFIALSVTLALAPVILPAMKVDFDVLEGSRLLWLAVSESMIGAIVGLCGRFFFLALQFGAMTVATALGMGNGPGLAIEDVEPLPTAATFITLTATVQFFVTEQHWDVLRALVGIYAVLPLAEVVGVGPGLAKITSALGDAFALTLQLTSPFIVYAIVINLMFGIANKLTPQIPVYFISMPFVYAGGILLLYATLGEVVRHFIAAFASWLSRV